MEADAVMRDANGLFPEEQTQRLRLAHHRLRAAQENVLTAQSRLDNYLDHKIVPEDLKRIG